MALLRFGVGFRWVVDVLIENGEGGGGGVGTDNRTGKSMRTHLSKLPFGKLPVDLSPKEEFNNFFGRTQ